MRRRFGLRFSGVNQSPVLPARTVAGGAKATVQSSYENIDSGLASRIYNAPAVANTDAETGDPIGAKPDMVENLYEPPVNQGRGLPSGADFFKQWWYGSNPTPGNNQ